MKNISAYTIVELLIVMGIFFILSGMIYVTISQPILQATLDSATNILIADIKQQQLKSMSGASNDVGSVQPFGIYFETNKYTLFSGSTYTPSNNQNFVVTLDEGQTLTNVRFPSNTLLFSRQSGEISNFLNGSTSVVLLNTRSKEQKTITINQLGSITLN
ncbi:MAG: prepilin-type N-terminal cleavage/methylation domain-containing protein [Candidatus Roizmanbacteria bacterium]